MSIPNLTISLEHCGPPPLPEFGKVRLAEVSDAPFIFNLLNQQMAKTFRIRGVEQIVYLM